MFILVVLSATVQIFGQSDIKENSNSIDIAVEFNKLLDSLELLSTNYSQDEYITHYLRYRLNKELFIERGLFDFYDDAFSPRASFVGEYKEALLIRDEYAFKQTWTAEDSINVAAFYPVDAREVVLKVADTTRIIIINEAHHIPHHRIFTTSVLEDLYKKGFRYLCVETIRNRENDSLFKNENYPKLWSGFYTREPLHGDMIRQALKIGYKIIPYESKSLTSDRELEQAKNIAKIFESNPDAKLLIHCGYMHIRNDWMAGNLKLFTGLNIFRIDQTATMEYSDEEFSNKYYQLADKIFKIDKPVFMTKGDNDYSFMFKNYVEAVLLLPKTKFEERPDWMSMNGYRKPYMVLKTEEMNEPVLIQAFYADENSETAVPVDMIITNESADKYYLMLPEGKYNIIYRKQGNVILKKEQVEIKK